MHELAPTLLIPLDLTPEPDVFRTCVQDKKSSISYIFPNYYTEGGLVDSPVGHYLGLGPQEGNALWPLIEELQDLRSYAYSTEAQADERTNGVSQILFTASVQTYLAMCIHNIHANVVESGGTSTAAINLIKEYVEAQDAKLAVEFNVRSDVLTAQIAQVERHKELERPASINGIPVLDLDSRTGRAPLSPASKRKKNLDYLLNEAHVNKHRLARLGFEWLSSRAILQILQEATT
jgi:hypothetical protein